MQAPIALPVCLKFVCVCVFKVCVCVSPNLTQIILFATYRAAMYDEGTAASDAGLTLQRSIVFHILLTPHDWTIQRINQIGYLPQQQSRNTTACREKR